MKKIEFTRKKLYDLLWKEPMSHLLSKNNLSYLDVKSACEKMEIPIPGSGHWSKLRFGKPTIKAPLPGNYKGGCKIQLAVKIKKKRMSKKKDNVSIAKKLIRESNHSLLQKTREYLVKQSIEYPNWQQYETRGCVLKMKTSIEAMERILNVYNRLIETLLSKGYEIKAEEWKTYVVIGDEKFAIHIREKQNRVRQRDEYGHWRDQYIPSGKLVFKHEGHLGKEWYDGKVRIEDQLDKIITYFEIEAEKERKYKIEAENRRRRNNFLKHCREVLEEKRKTELHHFKKLLSDASRWYQAKILRDYIEEIVSQNENQIESKKLRIWSDWAKQKADWFDPKINVRDKYLKMMDIEEENLSMLKSEKTEHKTHFYESRYHHFYR